MIKTTSKLNVQNDKRLTYDVYNGAQPTLKTATSTKVATNRIIMLSPSLYNII